MKITKKLASQLPKQWYHIFVDRPTLQTADCSCTEWPRNDHA